MNDLEFAWACGVFEGEGSICLRYTSGRRVRNKRPRLVLQISMTDEDVLIRFREAVACGNVYGPWAYPESSRHTKPFWKWQITGAPAEEVANRMRPMLCERRRQRLDERLRQVRAGRRLCAGCSGELDDCDPDCATCRMRHRGRAARAA